MLVEEIIMLYPKGYTVIIVAGIAQNEFQCASLEDSQVYALVLAYLTDSKNVGQTIEVVTNSETVMHVEVKASGYQNVLIQEDGNEIMGRIWKGGNAETEAKEAADAANRAYQVNGFPWRCETRPV
jgi:hypothetical protein